VHHYIRAFWSGGWGGGGNNIIVSHDRDVYEKDFGPQTLDEFQRMERFSRDKSWSPVLAVAAWLYVSMTRFHGAWPRILLTT